MYRRVPLGIRDVLPLPLRFIVPARPENEPEAIPVGTDVLCHVVPSNHLAEAAETVRVFEASASIRSMSCNVSTLPFLSLVGGLQGVG